MTLTQHSIAGALAAPLVAAVAGPADALLFAAASVLIDVDHYLVFIVRTRRFSPRAMFRWYDFIGRQVHEVPGFYFGACPFHTAEFFALLAASCLLLPALVPVLFGCIFHLLLDTVYQSVKGVLGHRAWSLVHDRLAGRRPCYLLEETDVA